MPASFRKRLLLCLSIISAILIVCFFVFRAPRTNGHSLSYWVEHIDQVPDATNAIREIGARAVPQLMRELRTRKRIHLRALGEIATRFPMLDIDQQELMKKEIQWDAHREKVATALRVLGETVRPPEAELLQLVREGDEAAVIPLAYLNPSETVSILTNGLTAIGRKRLHVLRQMQYFGDHREVVLPTLLAYTRQTNALSESFMAVQSLSVLYPDQRELYEDCLRRFCQGSNLVMATCASNFMQNTKRSDSDCIKQGFASCSTGFLVFPVSPRKLPILLESPIL
jgi:hypothetical protein